uniref:Uncharacterized protein n=1 Tax=Arundo donax TaxID=35708 RepID=A0A0A8XPE8_ARUDO
MVGDNSNIDLSAGGDGEGYSDMAADQSLMQGDSKGHEDKEMGEKVNISESEEETNSNTTPFGHAFGVRLSEDTIKSMGDEGEVEKPVKHGQKKNKGGGKEEVKEPRRCSRFSGQEDVNRVEKAIARAKFKDLISAPTTSAERRKRERLTS